MLHESHVLSPQQPAELVAAAGHLRRLVEAERRWAVTHYSDDRRAAPETVGIVGAGVMGVLIAAAALRRSIPVWIVDRDPQALATARQRIADKCDDVVVGRETGSDVDVGELIHLGDDLAALGRCQLVVEAVVERVAIKQQVLGALEPLLGPDAIIASNTSTIPWAQLATALHDPGRLCGGHFFLPTEHPPMVEIICGAQTRGETVAAMVAFAAAIDHLPLVVPDAPGFVVNRLLVPYLSEALQLLSEGVAVDAIESAALAFGMSLGPLRLLDEIGLDTALECAWTMAGDSPDLVIRSPLLVAMVKARRLGRKTGAGLFLYDADEAGTHLPNPDLAAVLARGGAEPTTMAPESIVVRLMAPMVLEATRMLARDHARHAGQIDLATVCGFGFPASRGGLLYWADHVGASEIVRLLETIAHLGGRAKPTPLLLEMARRGARFHPENELPPTA